MVEDLFELMDHFGCDLSTLIGRAWAEKCYDFFLPVSRACRQSNYVDPADHNDMRFHFPRAMIEEWEDSGHNPHFEHRDRSV